MAAETSTPSTLTDRITAIRAKVVPGIGAHLDAQAKCLLGEVGEIRHGRRRGEAGEVRLAEIVESIVEWPSGLRDQILDRVAGCLKVRARAARG